MENLHDYKIRREAVLWTLLQMKDLIGDKKFGKSKMYVLIDAMIRDYDCFSKYGVNSKVFFDSWNKKEPTKATLMPPQTTITEYKMLKLMKELF